VLKNWQETSLVYLAYRTKRDNGTKRKPLSSFESVKAVSANYRYSSQLHGTYFQVMHHGMSQTKRQSEPHLVRPHASQFTCISCAVIGNTV